LGGKDDNFGIQKVKPEPVSSIPVSLGRKRELFFTDIDGTITMDGLISASTYSSLWELHQCGIRVVPVTGRPAGWCDHIARMWPVDGVIGENGAFYFSYNRQRRRMFRRYLFTPEEMKEGKKKLQKVRERVLKEVPRCRIAADQPFRVADLAVDYKEDVGPLSLEEVERICQIAS